MKKNKRIRMFAVSSFLTTLLSFSSGASALGIVSRSCIGAGAQESVTVDWGFRSYVLWTASGHYRDGVLLHNINTQQILSSGYLSDGWYLTWRSYAGHLASEFWTGFVIGYHYQNDSGIVKFLGNSVANDCNLSNWGTS
jgi:hypothetical protein